MWYLSIFLSIVVIFVIVIWSNRAKRREYVRAVAKNYCKSHDLQFLDESVSFISWHFDRDKDNSRCFVRIYEFICTENGIERLKGKVILQNHLVRSVYLESNGNQDGIWEKSDDRADTQSDNVIIFKPRSNENKDKS